jgi:Domain of unknown function DUF4246, N-terminal
MRIKADWHKRQESRRTLISWASHSIKFRCTAILFSQFLHHRGLPVKNQNLLHEKSSTNSLSAMPDYPGLGLPLRPEGDRHERGEYHVSHYLIGAYSGSCGSISSILPIRELAMMDTMNTLTDKKDWAKKVFDEEIVSKRREEVLAVHYGYYNHLARYCKGLSLKPDRLYCDFLEGVMSTESFEYVCCPSYILCNWTI